MRIEEFPFGRRHQMLNALSQALMGSIVVLLVYGFVGIVLGGF